MKGARRGFSLLEMLLALALIMALLAALFTFLWDMLAVRDRMLREVGPARAIDTLIDGVERDLLTSIVGDSARGSGINGDATSLRILSRAVPARLSGRPGVSGSAVLGALERSDYRFVRGRGVIEAQRTALGPAAPAAGPASVLGGPIADVRFRYHDGRVWRDRFDSLEDDRLPVAVEIAVWLDAVDTDGDRRADAAPEVEVPGSSEGDFAFDDAFEVDAGDAGDPGRAPDRLRVIAVPGADQDREPTEVPEPTS